MRLQTNVTFNRSSCALELSSLSLGFVQTLVSTSSTSHTALIMPDCQYPKLSSLFVKSSNCYGHRSTVALCLDDCQDTYWSLILDQKKPEPAMFVRRCIYGRLYRQPFQKKTNTIEKDAPDNYPNTLNLILLNDLYQCHLWRDRAPKILSRLCHDMQKCVLINTY